MRPATKEAYRLQHDGALALSEVEANGMRIDVPRLDRTILKVGRRIDRLTERLKGDEVWKTWRRVYGAKASIGSRYQLGKVLFGEMGLKSAGRTKVKKQPQVNEETLARLGIPFVDRFLEVEKLKKFKVTYLEGIRREVVDDLLRPSFNLHLVRTYRSSSDSPNFQNIPIRDKVIGKLIRSCFIPRDGHTLVEIDYSGIEVKVAACYHGDPAMLEYIADPARDMHRDMAAECYMVEPEDVSKDMRFYAKNQFVFPEFYGDYYVNCARNLWNVIGSAGLETESGHSVEDVLLMQGVTDQEAFEDHIKEVERDFWEDRFPVYAEWKDKWYAKYQRAGYFRTLTGFVCQGVMGRNDVINYPVQGSAFHCLLFGLTRLVREIRRQKMGAKVVGQIHDSIVADVPDGEVEEYIGLARRVMVGELKAAWDWIVVPLDVDVEISSTNWHEMREVAA